LGFSCRDKGVKWDLLAYDKWDIMGYCIWYDEI
jgi:hypothetical protein